MTIYVHHYSNYNWVHWIETPKTLCPVLVEFLV